MKQQIGKEQWNELSFGEKSLYILWKKDNNYPNNQDLPTIGQLIEYLGDDLREMSFEEEWFVEFYTDKERDEVDFNSMEELIDALWEATKHKLKQKQRINN